jgi:allantoin racemase
MENGEKKFRFLLVQAFSLPESSAYQLRPFHGAKQERLMNYRDIAPLLEDVEWDLHPGATAPHGDWPVELGEEFLVVGASRLPIVREACESGKYNAIVLLGGGDPGFPEAREIARRYRIPVTANAHAQMHVAALLGNKFSIVDISEAHNMHMYNLVVRYRFAERCASIRNINFPMPRPAFPDARPLHREHARALAGERSEMVEAAIAESVAAIEEDGAEVIILGCSAAFWLQPLLQRRLEEIGWEVPVLEGYRCAIGLAKLMVNLGIDASGLAFPSDHPKKWRRKKVF